VPHFLKIIILEISIFTIESGIRDLLYKEEHVRVSFVRQIRQPKQFSFLEILLLLNDPTEPYCPVVAAAGGAVGPGVA
jgi:hypothetical protein